MSRAVGGRGRNRIVSGGAAVEVRATVVMEGSCSGEAVKVPDLVSGCVVAQRGDVAPGPPHPATTAPPPHAPCSTNASAACTTTRKPGSTTTSTPRSPPAKTTQPTAQRDTLTAWDVHIARKSYQAITAPLQAEPSAA